MRLCFLTSTPLNVTEGSGTFVGIHTLAAALDALGVEVAIESPRRRLPVYTLERWLFNRGLRRRSWGGCDAIVGFDLDGFGIASRTPIPHVAALKGVIADELRFQRGATWATMALQKRWEARHARRADLVIATSRYSAEHARAAYGLRRMPAVVPELIDLAEWRSWLARHPGRTEPGRFTVLCVCRLYRRKRIDVLLGAAARLRDRIPGLAVRIVGDGPEAEEFRRVWREERLEGMATFLGEVPRGRLAAEYNGCDVFCLPSVQEGFGIVFLEAMAAGKPVVAARAAAVPEVLPQGLLAEPDDPAVLADALEALYRCPERRAALAAAGARRVEDFDAPVVARQFLASIEQVVKPGGSR